jgi:predicted short-subunit dehydrogenase-like oxidoreductase (DUF2520 family)
MLRAMGRRPSISIVGAGSLASGLAASLRAKGYKIVEIITRARPISVRKGRILAKSVGAESATMGAARLDADVLVIAVPDDAIAGCALAVAKRGFGSRVVLHCSGALPSDELKPLKKAGAAVGSMHPLMSFVRTKRPELKGVLFTVEGDSKAVAVASKMARDIGGVVFPIDKRKKALYHAFGAFTSPLLIAHLSAAEVIGRAAGLPPDSIRRAMRPIIEATLDNYFRKGPEKAFSGPLVRGDVETIRKHHSALSRRPAARNLYIALVLQAMTELPVDQKTAIRKLLRNSSPKN